MSHHLALGLCYGFRISTVCNLLQPLLNCRSYPATLHGQ